MPSLRIAVLTGLSIAIFGACIVFGPTFIDPFTSDVLDHNILISIRMPRVVVAFLIGMALGASGAVLQGILKNPLADPYVLGISSGAALAAASGILSGFYIFGKFTLPLSAFAGACTASILVGIFGWKRGSLLPERLLLAGIGLGFLFYSAMMLLISVSSNEGVRRTALWVFGDLSIADWSHIPYGLLFISAGLYIAVARAKALNALMLGDEMAYSLGFSVQRERLLLFISVALMTGASVSLGGTIGFIGLLIPHMVRFFVGANSKYSVPVSALCGGAFLCMSDMIGRTLLAPMEIPAGIVTALIGSPYFLYLLRRRDVFEA
ncbi:MAG: iron ABC transporter permease [Nitrospirota bacterium]